MKILIIIVSLISISHIGCQSVGVDHPHSKAQTIIKLYRLGCKFTYHSNSPISGRQPSVYEVEGEPYGEIRFSKYIDENQMDLNYKISVPASQMQIVLNAPLIALTAGHDVATTFPVNKWAKFNQLKRLTIHGKGWSDRSILEIKSSFGRHIKELCLIRCTQVTEGALREIVMMNSLEKVMFFRCRLSEQSVRLLQVKRPDLKVYYSNAKFPPEELKGVE